MRLGTAGGLIDMQYLCFGHSTAPCSWTSDLVFTHFCLPSAHFKQNISLSRFLQSYCWLGHTQVFFACKLMGRGMHGLQLLPACSMASPHVTTCDLSFQAMKQDYVSALAKLPTLGAESMMPTSMHMRNSSTLQPSTFDPAESCQPSTHHKAYDACQLPSADPQPAPVPATVPANPQGSAGSAHRHLQSPHAGLAIQQQQQQQHALHVSRDQPRSAQTSHQNLGQSGSAYQPAANDLVMQDASQLPPDEEICCAQLATHAQPTLSACNSSAQQGDVRTLPHHPHHLGNNVQCNNRSQAAASRLSVASSASTSNVSRQDGNTASDQQVPGNSSRPHWMRGGDVSSAGGCGADRPAAVQQPKPFTASASSAAPEKENARPGIATVLPFVSSRWFAAALGSVYIMRWYTVSGYSAIACCLQSIPSAY